MRRRRLDRDRARILRQLLVESAVLALAGGFLGWVVAMGGLRWFEHATAALHRPAWLDFSMDARVLIYFGSITLATSVLFGLAPALRLARVDVHHSIKEGGQGAAGGTPKADRAGPAGRIARGAWRRASAQDGASWRFVERPADVRGSHGNAHRCVRAGVHIASASRGAGGSGDRAAVRIVACAASSTDQMSN
jgi:hypothetical protein